MPRLQGAFRRRHQAERNTEVAESPPASAWRFAGHSQFFISGETQGAAAAPPVRSLLRAVLRAAGLPGIPIP